MDSIFKILERLLDFIDKITDFLKWVVSLIIKRFFTKTVKVIMGDKQHIVTQWSIAHQAGKPIMHIHGEFSATNVTDENIHLVKINISKCKREKIIYQHTLVRHHKRNIYSTYPILPKTTSNVAFDVMYQDILQDKGKPFKAKIYVFDQFGNKHKLKMSFRSS